MALTAAEKKRRQRERRAGMCPACTVTCLRCGKRCVDDRGKFAPHQCPQADKPIERASCDGCNAARVDRRRATKASAAAT